MNLLRTPRGWMMTTLVSLSVVAVVTGNRLAGATKSPARRPLPVLSAENGRSDLDRAAIRELAELVSKDRADHDLAATELAVLGTRIAELASESEREHVLALVSRFRLQQARKETAAGMAMLAAEQRRFDSLQRDLNSLSANISTAEAESKKLDRDVEGLREQCAEMNGRIEKILGQIESKEELRDQRQRELNSIRAKNAEEESRAKERADRHRHR